MAFFNEAFRPPNLMTYFSFALGSLKTFPKPALFQPICPHSPQSLAASPKSAWLLDKTRLPRAKQKLVLRLGNLKASLENATAKSIHNTSSNQDAYTYTM